MVLAAIASAGKLERALLTLSRQNALGRCTHLAVLDACYHGQYTLLTLCWYAAVELTIHNCWYLTFAYSQLVQATVVTLKAEKSFGILII